MCAFSVSRLLSCILISYAHNSYFNVHFVSDLQVCPFKYGNFYDTDYLTVSAFAFRRDAVTFLAV